MQTQEQWKDIPGYEGLYQVSNKGNVKSLNYKRTGKEKQIELGFANGYLLAKLSINNTRKTFAVHKLVAMTFLDHKPCGMELVVDHINSDKLDNRLENLRVLTNRENCSKEIWLKKDLPIGVIKKGNRFKSSIQINKKIVYLGSFSTQEEASKAYQDKLKEIQQQSNKQ